MTKKYLIITFFIFLFNWGVAQTSIKIDAENKPLNAVLLELRETYDYQFSYSDNQLSKYKISLHKTFSNKDKAIEYILNEYPLKLKKAGSVYIIIPDKRKEKRISRASATKIIGQIVEAGSYEPLPFSHILINNQQMVSDVLGNFNYTASIDSAFHIRISHLGYYVYDTTLVAGINQVFTLTPSTETLPEVIVKDKVIEKSTIIGERSGKMKLNYTISKFLPGQGDNSVFNLLRSMPGIQAAGEQSNDLLIWGSYEGQSPITFDEFTIFGLKNYNDNISSINPFMVKDIEIFKGGFEAKYGNRVGGIVNITGKNGNMKKPSFSMNINTTTVNGLVEIPLFKKSSFMAAYRQTYYNLYNRDDFNIFAPTRTSSKSGGIDSGGNNSSPNFDFEVYPDDYVFRDLNLKYTFIPNSNNLLYISFYKGGDNFSLSTSTEFGHFKNNNEGSKSDKPFNIEYINKEENNQEGLSLFYGKTWDNYNTTKLIISHSKFEKQIQDTIETNSTETNFIYNDDNANIGNTAQENKVKLQHTITLLENKQIDIGLGVVNNTADITTVTHLFDTISLDQTYTTSSNRLFAYFQENIPLGRRFNFKAGVRLNLSQKNNKYLLEPRISGLYQINEHVKLNSAFGLYNQFMYKIANVDRDTNYNYLWITADDDIPTLRAMHAVFGFNLVKNKFTLDIEGYYKHTNNYGKRYSVVNDANKFADDEYVLFTGQARTYGIDIYIKKDFKNSSIWTSYTLSKAEQCLSETGENLPDFELAPQDQRHEFKITGIVNIKKIYLSGSYVYGSGMQIIKEAFEYEDDIDYNRVDVAFTYKINAKRFSGETGISVLNVFDTQNLKYSNLKTIHLPASIGTVNIYSNAVPFTPIVFLKLKF